VPLISFDIILNVYLTSLFLHPLRRKYMGVVETISIDANLELQNATHSSKEETL
jgi:hypothetical protein